MPTTPRSTHHPLLPHPATAQSAVMEIHVDLTHGERDLVLRYRLAGNVALLMVPPAAPPVRTEELWRHTCFEAFLTRPGSDEYWEYNFSPSSAWAAYHFSGYRAGMAPLEQGAAPAITFEQDANGLMLAVALDLDCLARARGLGGLRLGLAAVIEDREHALSYWALQHAGEKPDFHRVDSFVVVLA